MIKMLTVEGSMPHLSMEYSAGRKARADLRAVAEAAYSAVVAVEISPVAGIRVRMGRADIAIVGDALPENDFLAMTLTAGAGRSPEAMRAAGDAIFAAVRTALSDPPLHLVLCTFSGDSRVRPEPELEGHPDHARVSED